MLTALMLIALFFNPSLVVPGNFCFENLPDSTHDLCGLTSGNVTKIFQAPNQPLEENLVGFSLVFIWGGLMGIMWFKTERIDVMGITGLCVAATITGLSPQAVGIGLFMLLVSLGILLYQVLRQRLTLFT